MFLDQARFKTFFDFKKGSEIRPKNNGFEIQDFKRLKKVIVQIKQMSSSQNVTLILCPAHLMTKRSHMSEKNWKASSCFLWTSSNSGWWSSADDGHYLATSHFILSEKISISGSKGAQKASSQSKGMSNTKTSVKMFRPEVNWAIKVNYRPLSFTQSQKARLSHPKWEILVNDCSGRECTTIIDLGR